MTAFLYDGNQDLFKVFVVPDPPPPEWLVPRRGKSPRRFQRIGFDLDETLGEYVVYRSKDVMTRATP